MINKELSEAFVETLDILEHMDKETVNKISPAFMEYLYKNASQTYKPNLNHNVGIKNMKLKKETKIILAIIYRQFWCDDEKKKILDKRLLNNQKNFEKEMREKYNPNNIFN